MTSEAGDRRRWRRDRGSTDRLPNRLCAKIATARPVCAQSNLRRRAPPAGTSSRCGRAGQEYSRLLSKGQASFHRFGCRIC